MDTGRHAGRGFRGGDPHDLRADFPATAEGNLVRLLPLAPVPGRTTLQLSGAAAAGAVAENLVADRGPRPATQSGSRSVEDRQADHGAMDALAAWHGGDAGTHARACAIAGGGSIGRASWRERGCQAVG